MIKIGEKERFVCSPWTNERKSVGVDLPSDVIISFFAIVSGLFIIRYLNISIFVDKKKTKVCRDLMRKYMRMGKECTPVL